MKFALKFLGFFTLSFLILTISYDGQSFFDILNDKTAPIIDSALHGVKYGIRKGISMGKNFGKKLFSNSIPSYSDKVKTSQSGILRTINKSSSSDRDEGENTNNFIDQYSNEQPSHDNIVIEDNETDVDRE